MNEDETATQRFLREAEERAAYDSLGDDTMTSDAREVFEQLRKENTDLATEVAQLREQLGNSIDARRALEADRDHDTELFFTRRERLVRAVLGERAWSAELTERLAVAAEHIETDHASLDSAKERLNQHECAVRELARQRDELTAALSKSSDAVLKLIGERDEARRALDSVVTQLGGLPEPIRAADSGE
ncbi:MAG TPA: hypothetical protein VM430_13430 [Microbacterium sp.]|nr:hypothetical protein [Microbacterium sp.]